MRAITVPIFQPNFWAFLGMVLALNYFSGSDSGAFEFGPAPNNINLIVIGCIRLLFCNFE